MIVVTFLSVLEMSLVYWITYYCIIFLHYLFNILLSCIFNCFIFIPYASAYLFCIVFYICFDLITFQRIFIDFPCASYFTCVHVFTSFSLYWQFLTCAFLLCVSAGRGGGVGGVGRGRESCDGWVFVAVVWLEETKKLYDIGYHCICDRR